MSALGGSSTISPGQVPINGLHIPGLEEAQANPMQTPAQQIVQQPEKPQIVLNPNPPAEPVIELPTFGEEEPESHKEPEEVQEDDSDLPETAAAENFKKLRGVVKQERQAKKELQAKLEEYTKKVEGYEKGETIPEIIRAKDERIASLEPYEKIVNLKMSPEYQKNFVEPALELRTQLEKLGTDYGIPEETMHELVGVENQRQLGDFISRHFDAPTGLEVRNTVKALQDLGTKALEAEKEPETVLQALKAQYKERQEEEKRERNKVFESIAKDGWAEAMDKTKTEGVYKELILHPTDIEFNKKVVEPNQYKASQNYGALIRQLAENGLKTLPAKLAKDLARVNQLAVGGAYALEAKEKAEKERNALLQHQKRTQSYVRPNLGGSNGSGSSNKESEGSKPLLTPRTAGSLAAKVFNS